MGELDGFDVEAYAAKYSGHNRINRLIFMGKQCPDLRRDAHSVLLQDLKNSKNMNLYVEVAQLAADECENIPESILNVDHAYVENVKRNSAQQHERLEQELNSYKSTMIKESIRMGYNDLGDFFYQVGDLSAALKSYAHTRDYCTADKHIIEMCLNVSKVGLHLRNYSHVKSYLTKLEQVIATKAEQATASQIPTDPSFSILKSKIAATFGLVALQEKNYREAALKFIECQVDIGSTYNDVVHAEDIALYGGICALASLKRDMLKEKVINNPSFKAFLELLPWLRELINDFYSSNYAACLNALEKMKSEMRLDMYLSEHVDTLCQEIRNRGIIQFFYPYLSVDVHQMSNIFQTPVDALEQEICALITAKKIDARMDSYEKILYAYHPNKRSATYKRAFDVGRKYASETRNLMLRMSLLKQNLVISDS